METLKNKAKLSFYIWERIGNCASHFNHPMRVGHVEEGPFPSNQKKLKKCTILWALHNLIHLCPISQVSQTKSQFSINRWVHLPTQYPSLIFQKMALKISSSHITIKNLLFQFIIIIQFLFIIIQINHTLGMHQKTMFFSCLEMQLSCRTSKANAG